MKTLLQVTWIFNYLIVQPCNVKTEEKITFFFKGEGLDPFLAILYRQYNFSCKTYLYIQGPR